MKIKYKIGDVYRFGIDGEGRILVVSVEDDGEFTFLQIKSHDEDTDFSCHEVEDTCGSIGDEDGEVLFNIFDMLKIVDEVIESKNEPEARI